ncbi:TraX family protein [Candidatus Albibeggiatoa sp. nov. BB20]|uniref:TraX family protein n=1 Tax=Candidatus Albibeggiatoa sp. nov. BB20 TaxID=3162723 RepID=UPI003365700B
MTITNRLKSYDLLITIAIISMVIDHTGYFFIDYEPLRIIGRLAAPVFLFLAGYGNNHIKPSYLFWGLLLTFCIGGNSLDILITFFILATTYHYLLRHLSSISTLILVLSLSLLAFAIQMSFEGYYYPIYIHIAFFYFMAGKSLYNKQLYYSITYLILAILFQFPLYFAFASMPYSMLAPLILLLVLYSYFYLDVLFYKNSVTNKYLRFAAQYSLQIYIVHIVAFSVLQQLLQLN